MEKTAASKFGSSPAKLRFFTIFASDYPTDMNFRKISLLVLILLIADQALSKSGSRPTCTSTNQSSSSRTGSNCASSKITARPSGCTSPPKAGSTGGNSCSGFSGS